MTLSITSLNRLSAGIALLASIKLSIAVATQIPWISHFALSTALLACMCHMVTSFLNIRAQHVLSMGFQAWWGLLAISMVTAPGRLEREASSACVALVHSEHAATEHVRIGYGIALLLLMRNGEHRV